jgi:RIO-like serine/threonine protein kinase
MFTDIDIQNAIQGSCPIAKTSFADIYKFIYQNNSYVIKASSSDHAAVHYPKEFDTLSGQRPEGVFFPLHHKSLNSCVIHNKEYTAAVIMDFIPGKSLQDIIGEKGCVNQNLALSVMTDVIQTLKHTNSLGYYHLDIVTNNIIVDESEGRSWLIDYTGCYYEDCGTVYYSGKLESSKGHLQHQLWQIAELFGQLIDCTNNDVFQQYQQMHHYASEYNNSNTLDGILKYCQGS